MSKRSRSKPNIPIHRESLFWILFPVSCLLSSVFCLLSSAQHAYPAHLAKNS